ncbi:hypothetical protein PENANT_c058G11464 [Penicillium antarcticum]|uniref:RGS domain-containing protein n=1 Tax=Penicillium antarcticum TaxID=416450 RepID=A0A1V6PQE3_9EURO|nr:hypothetical protein PENANT_c058G11464 [Penicillium antarcticum]
MYYESFASAYIQLGCLSRNCSERPEVDLLLRHWQNLVSTFLLSGSPQEIDLSTEERMGILSYRITAIPPPPYVLEHVVRRLYDQIEESMFPEFLFRDSGKDGAGPRHTPSALLVEQHPLETFRALCSLLAYKATYVFHSEQVDGIARASEWKCLGEAICRHILEYHGVKYAFPPQQAFPGFGKREEFSFVVTVRCLEAFQSTGPP